jgi:hypothetical protein
MPTELQNRCPPPRKVAWSVLLREIAIVICGLTMAVIPLALWIAWSRPVFAGVLIACVAAMGAVVLLSRFGGEDVSDKAAEPEPGKQKLDDEFLEELRRHEPLTHHHRRLSDPRIRRKMARLRDMIRRNQR